MIDAGIRDRSRRQFRFAIQALNRTGISSAVGGALAVFHYTGILRPIDDLDLFLLPNQCDAALGSLQSAGFSTSIEEAHWLARAERDGERIDLITGFGNWLTPVDQSLLDRSEQATLLGLPVRVVAVDDLIWSKAYVCARDRYDGSDIAHLLNSARDRIDWTHLLRRFGPHGELLLNHLIMFRHIYPSERQKLPRWVLQTLIDRVEERGRHPAAERTCQGTLLDRKSYNVDVIHFGFGDPREQLAAERGFDPDDVVRLRSWVQRTQASE